MYERQHGSDLEIGSYAHRPIFVDPDEIPSNEEAALSPTELPFTQEDFDLQMEQALELFPEILGDESVGIQYAINGLLSLTPDGMPLLGESPEVHGLWSAAAVWVKEAPGIGRTIAEWMTHGIPDSTRMPPTSPASTSTAGRRATSTRGPAKATTRRTASSTRASSGSRTGTFG